MHNMERRMPLRVQGSGLLLCDWGGDLGEGCRVANQGWGYTLGLEAALCLTETLVEKQVHADTGCRPAS